MISAQARSLASAGVAVVVPDLYGTGDSFGEFSEADWDVWCSDLIQWVDWISDQGAERIYFLGIRLGCLLALDVSSKIRKRVEAMLFWQPVCNGQQAMTQFLRLRMAASIMGGVQEKVSDLRKRLNDEGQLEVAGYEVSDRLIKQVDLLFMQNMNTDRLQSVTWFEIASNSEKPLSMVSRKIVDNWQQAGISIKVEMIQGESFWMTQEISMAPALLQRTTSVLSSGCTVRNDLPVSAWQNLQRSNLASEYSTHFSCEGEVLPAIVHSSSETAKRGVLIVVGGPQYRIGSHRQFVLLARALAAEGIPVFRFDYRGMGDASGTLSGFETIKDDIRSAVDCFQSVCPAVKEVVIWGLCDAATAATFYAPDDSRIQGLILLNPWVRSDEGEAKAYIRYYYLKRLHSRDFWRKVFRGRFQVLSSLKSLLEMIGRATGREDGKGGAGQKRNSSETSPFDSSLALRMERALSQYDGKVLLLLSGNDLTATEFNQAVGASPRFQKMLIQKNYRIKKLEDADHTFSRRIWRDIVAHETLNWLKSW